MWRVYLLEFIIVLILSLSWVHILDKHKNEKNESDERDQNS
jgi:hypothetical protein